MKRVLSIISAVLLLSLSALPCHAAETTKTEPGSEEIGVYINASHTPASGTVGTPIDDGKYTVETPDGTEITVKPETVVEGLSLVVYPIPATDADAYKWFEDSAKDLGNKRYYYDIYFIDAAGNRVDGGKCEVTITLPDGYGTPKTALLGKDGKLTAITNSVHDGKVKFTMNGNGYYVIAEAAGQTDLPDPPQTGDDSMMWLWIVIMTASLIGVIVIATNAKKRRGA